ncbi:MAG: hypothetical protein AAGI69_24420 [Cyanobacteria bacterium P01_H01_bin.21]
MEAGTVMELKVHSRNNCYRLSPEQLNAIQNNGVSVTLKPGTNIVKLLENNTPYTIGTGAKAEPWVLLWIYGGKFINKKTNVEVVSTWASLTGYDDSLTIDIVESATLCAFLLAPSTDSRDKLTLSVNTL